MRHAYLVGLQAREHVVQAAGVMRLLVYLALHRGGVPMQALDAHRLLGLSLITLQQTYIVIKYHNIVK